MVRLVVALGCYDNSYLEYGGQLVEVVNGAVGGAPLQAECVV